MKGNQRGSFTVEASIILPIIILIVVVFFKSIITQYLFYYGRGILRLKDDHTTMVEKGIYFDTRIKSREVIIFDKNNYLIECESQELNYLRWAHHYLMAEEIIGVFNEEVLQKK